MLFHNDIPILLTMRIAHERVNNMDRDLAG